MRSRMIGLTLAALGVTVMLAGAAGAVTLVASPFITSYGGWTDTFNYGFMAPEAGSYPAWGVLLEKGVLMENSDGCQQEGGTATPGHLENDGQFIPYVMVNSATTTSAYTLTGNFATSDDDGLGMVFGYQDADNYFRLGVRRQATNYGFYGGLTVSKVVGGVITGHIAGPVSSFVGPTGDKPFTLKLKVDGGNFEVYASRPDGREPTTPQLSGSDSDLATLGAGKYGVMSWYERGGGHAWGVQLDSMTVDNGSNGSIEQNHTFTDASPIAWRKLSMTNALNKQEADLAHQGDFKLDFRNSLIQDDSNGYEWATASATRRDFIGAATVVDEAEAQNIGDMEMKVRIACDDNEGPGLLFRVQDDSTFYRLNFVEENSTSTSRPPRGVSIQKCLSNGAGVAPTWTQLTVSAPEGQFLYQNKTGTGTTVPFDVKVTVTNTGTTTAAIHVEVLEVGGSTTYTFDAADSTSPLLYGTVGLTNWGGGGVASSMYGTGVMWSGYGGDPNIDWVTGEYYIPGEAAGGSVPEPGLLVLIMGAVAALAGLRVRRRVRPTTLAVLVAAVCMMTCLGGVASAAPLVGSPFISTSYDGWTDTYNESVWVGVGASPPLWGVLVANDALCDPSDGAYTNGGTYTGGFAGDSTYKPFLMVNSNYATPTKYSLTGTLSSTDDDGLGLIFGYQDADNYCRVGLRTEVTGSLGFSQGISLDRVVGGVVTQVAAPNVGYVFSTDNTPFVVKIDVDGTACKVTFRQSVGGAENVYYDGPLPGLDLLGHQYGFMNWRSRILADSDQRCFGAQLHSLAVDEGSDGSAERTHTFGAASPLPWREAYMMNAEGAVIPIDYDKGNFRVELTHQGIVDDSNPSLSATATAPRADFIGSAIVLDDPTKLSMTNYEMQVRMECGDNEGPGLLVRVLDDKTFYRVNFTAEASTSTTRPYQGLSIQKCDGREAGNPVWTDLLHESVSPFVYANHVDHGETFPFDVKVIVTNIGTSATKIRVEVIDDPEELATPYSWEVTDSSNPILSGTVGLANWGAGNIDYGRTIGVRWLGYGGDVNAPLVMEASVIPPPEIPGDADRDGDVDADDARDMAAAWGTVTGATWEMGDFNNDHAVNAADASILAANYGYVWPGTGGEAAGAVPEPGVIALTLGALVALAFARRRR